MVAVAVLAVAFSLAASPRAPSPASPQAPSGGQEPAPEPELKAFLTRWADSLRDVKALRVRFTQTKHLRILRKPRHSTGVALLRGHRVLMTVTDARGGRETELLVAGDEVRIHYPRQRRLEVYPADATGRSKAPFPMFGEDVEQLPKLYHVELRRTEKDRCSLLLRPRDPEASIREVRMRFRGARLVAVEQRDRHGNRVALEITEFAVNPPLEPKQLQLDVPDGTEVVRFDHVPH